MTRRKATAMSIATVLLLVGALGIMILMNLVGHGSHGASHGAHEGYTTSNDAPPPGGPKTTASSRNRHGCC